MAGRVLFALAVFGGLARAQEPPPTVYPPPPATADAFPQPTSVAAPPPNAKPEFKVFWDNGLFLETKEKEFRLHLGAMFHYDGAWYDATPGLEVFPGGVGRLSDGVALRRGRIRADGTVYERYGFHLEFEFANAIGPANPTAATVSNAAVPLEAWVQADRVPTLGTVRVGLQKEWFSLEHTNSARFLPFLERSYQFDAGQPTAFNNGRAVGVSAFRTWAGERVFSAAGAYKNADNFFGFGFGDGEYAVTGRVAALVVDEREAQRYWMLGGAMSHRDPVNDRVRVRARSSVRGAPLPLLNALADTGGIAATSQTLYNLQTAGALGRVSVAAEYLANLVRRPELATARFQGLYAEALVFLTGEHRGWDAKLYRTARVIPLRDLGPGGWGAWEVGVRYQYLDLDDRGVLGGRLNAVTLGLNWYWNPNVKVQFNYDYLDRDGGVNPLAAGQVHSFGTRVAMDF